MITRCTAWNKILVVFITLYKNTLLKMYVFTISLATVAVVKSRDMHWGLLAQKEHKDVSLASLRMLLVADGANPCK